MERLWVDDAEALASVLDRLRHAPCIAFDTESNSMHAYHERVCLVQCSVPGLDVVIDPFAVDLVPLGGVLADRAHEKVLHAAEYDIVCLRRTFGLHIDNLFDTMLAARVLGWERFGLGSILEDRFGVKLDKRYQRYDWGRRPLDDDALEYARLDTHHLLALRDIQLEELHRRERLELFRHACERQCGVSSRPKVFDPDEFWQIKGMKELDPAGIAVLRELFVLRETWAERLDRPPFRVLADPMLLVLARRRPTTAGELGRIKSIGRWGRGSEGAELLEAIDRGTRAPVPTPPVFARPPRAFVKRYEALRTWRRVAATELATEPDILLPKSALHALAEANPTTADELEQVTELDDWERSRFGSAMLEVLRSVR